MPKRIANSNCLIPLIAAVSLSGCTGNAGLSTDNPDTTGSAGSTNAPPAGQMAGSGSEPTAGAANSPASCSVTDEQMQSAMLAAINQSRASARQCGTERYPAAAAVVWDSRLANAALAHSSDMASNNFFSHTGSDGLSVSDRAEQAGFNWQAIGENIASGQQSVIEVHEDWLQSLGHCSNIMAAHYTVVGASCAQRSDSPYSTYWTVVFGR